MKWLTIGYSNLTYKFHKINARMFLNVFEGGGVRVELYFKENGIPLDCVIKNMGRRKIYPCFKDFRYHHNSSDVSLGQMSISFQVPSDKIKRKVG